MWFKLATADFKDKNLGTMSSISNSWSVSCTTSGGIVKTTGDGTVTKGGTWTGTFTLSTGAEFTSATLTPSTAGTVTSTPSGTTVTVTIANVSANCTLAVVATGGSTGDGGNGGNGGSDVTPGTTTLLAQNATTIPTSPKRLAKDAYVANMQQIFAANSTIGYIELPLVTNSGAVTTAITLPALNVWVFNANTNIPVAKIIDSQSYTSEASTAFTGCQAIKVTINKSFDYPFYFGYSNEPTSGNAAISYFSEAGNYLSGTSFAIGTAIEASSGSVAIYAAVYGEGSLETNPDNVDSLTQIAFYNESASAKMAGNCYVASPSQTVPTNTKISILDIMVAGTSIEGVNVYVVNGETNTIVEMLADEQTMTPIKSSRIGANVIRLNVNKTYAYPVYFMFNAERTNSSANAMLMASNLTDGVLLTDDETKPAVGDVLSTFTSKYNIGHAIYS